MKSMSPHKTESQLFKSYSSWGGSGENNSSHGPVNNGKEKLKRVFASIKNSKILLFKTIFPLKLFSVVRCYG